MALRKFAILSAMIVPILLLAAFRLGQATEFVTMDGVWWQTLSEHDQITAVKAMLPAIHVGYVSGRVDGFFEAVEAFRRVIPYNKEEPIIDNWHRTSVSREPEFTHTFGVYIDQINVWFEAHPKRTSSLPADLLFFCLADKPEIKDNCKTWDSAADSQ